MKRGKAKIKSIIAISLVFSSIVSFSPNTSVISYADTAVTTNASEEETRLTFEEEQGPILHAWNWSFNTIAENLDKIAEAGYKSIQVSPIQGNKDLKGNCKNTKDWWILYQPINFKIGNEQLGNEEKFTYMCEKAHEKGIKIIVDVIANHTANTPTNSDEPADEVDPEIMALGKEVAYHRLEPVGSWDSRYDVTRKDVGLPDLNTENPKIQEMARKFFEECLKCGADGFRVDTAKHIALPNEADENGEEVKSDFWPNAFTGLKTNKENKPYIYGEVLQGSADNFYEYSKYINLTSSNYGGNVRKAVGLGTNPDVSKIEDYDAKDVSPKKLITWVESHDTYANDSEESTKLTDEQIRNGWALIASRADANPLFFNRPAGRGKLDGLIGEAGDDNWRSADVVAINKFRNAMINQDEKLVEISKEIMMIQRGTTEDSTVKGLVIVNLGSDYEVTNQEVNLEDGTYSNCGNTNSTFIVADGKISGTIKSGITVLYKGGEKENEIPSPVVSIDKDNQSFNGELNLTLSVANSSNATYKINNEEAIPYSDKTSISIGKDNEPGDVITVRLNATNEDNSRKAEETYTYIKKAENSKATVYFEKPSDWKTPLYVYAYNEIGEKNNKWPGEKMIKIGENLYKYELKDFTNCNVIINDWYYKHKTGDLSLKYDGMMKYGLDGKWDVTEKLSEDPNVEPDIEEKGTSKVFIQIPDSWKDSNEKYYDDVCIYMYGVEEIAGWPGVPMEKVEGKEGLYTYTLPKGLEGSMVLFNANGGRVQVPENTGFKAPANSTMIFKDGEWTEKLEGVSKAYFRKPADWGEPNIYVWNDSGEIVSWPGTPMEKVEGTETLYAYTLPRNYENVVFNDGANTNKTGDLRIPEESSMIYDNGEFRKFKSDDLEEPEIQTDKEGVTKVYFNKTLDWDKVNVYAFNPVTGNEVKKWPGVSAKDEGNNLYSYSLPSGFESAKVVFNNGNSGKGNQTGDLETKVGHTMMYDAQSDSLKSMSKVYFKNKYGWDKVRVHYWKDNGESTTWPGESLVSYGDDLYGYTLPDGFENASIKFNNNNKGEETKAVDIKEGETYIFTGNDEGDSKNKDGEWREFEANDIPAVEPEEPSHDKDDEEDSKEFTKAYFENTKGWKNLKIYFYTENSDGSLKKKFKDWPGVDLKSEGNDLYSYELPDGYKNSTLIFNGIVTTSAGVSAEGAEEVKEETKQTENLKIKAGQTMIFKDGVWESYTAPIKNVTITGTTKVGMSLKAEVTDSNKNVVTSGVTYQWYRSSSKDGVYEKIEGADQNSYKLTINDKNKYIKLIVEDEQGNEVSSEASSIVKYSSSSSSSSSHHSSSSDKDTSASDGNAGDNSNSNTNNSGNTTTDDKTQVSNGWNKNEDGTWSFVESGKAATGWKFVNGSWYLMNINGVMETGWKAVNGTWYYMNASGAMETGWELINNKWYYLNESGGMEKGWKLLNDKWYYLNDNGDMATGWKEISGKWYYLYNDGSMASNTIIDGYRVNESGAWI